MNLSYGIQECVPNKRQAVVHTGERQVGKGTFQAGKQLCEHPEVGSGGVVALP